MVWQPVDRRVGILRSGTSGLQLLALLVESETQFSGELQFALQRIKARVNRCHAHIPSVDKIKA